MARPTTVSTADLFDEIHIDLWGTKFRQREATRTIEEKVSQQWDAFEALPDDTTKEEALEPLCDLLDVVLEPLGDEKGKKTKVKTVVKREYAADRIGFAHVLRLCERLGEANGVRPT